MTAKGKSVWDDLTDSEKQEIAEYAEVGCTNKHIAELMDIPDSTFKDSDKLRRFCSQKRAVHRANILTDQRKHSKTTPVGAIWQGKQFLGQTDKQQIKHGVDEATASLLSLVDGATRGKLPADDND